MSDCYSYMFFFHVGLLYKQYSLKNIKIILLKRHGLFRPACFIFCAKISRIKITTTKTTKKNLNVFVVYYRECNLMKTIMLLYEQCNFSKSQCSFVLKEVTRISISIYYQFFWLSKSSIKLLGKKIVFTKDLPSHVHP